MPVAKDSGSRLMIGLRQRLVSRFATKASRFRLAVSSGFVIAAVGFLIAGADTKFGEAQLFWGGMSFPDSGAVTPQAPPPSPQYYTPRRHRSHVARAENPVRRVRYARDESGPAGSLSGKSICVRLCDGFAFPVGDYHGSGDRMAHEATCQSECPGAKTALFVVPKGSDSIGDASEVGSGRNYSQLPDAFHYTTYIDGTCSCHPRAGNRIKSILRDFTLRRGDAVMTSKGLQVFHGGTSYPYKRRDFVALSRSRDIRSADRANLRAIERASLGQPPIVAETDTPARISDARRNSTKTLEHQANNSPSAVGGGL